MENISKTAAGEKAELSAEWAAVAATAAAVAVEWAAGSAARVAATVATAAAWAAEAAAEAAAAENIEEVPDNIAQQTDNQGDNMNKLNLDQIVLTSGSHDKDNQDVCLLEACALMAGEPKTDHPTCVYAPFAAAGRSINDGPWGSDEERTAHLRKYVPLLIGTSSLAGSPERDARVAKAAAKVARQFADNFDNSLTSAERIAKNAPILMDALIEAAK